MNKTISNRATAILMVVIMLFLNLPIIDVSATGTDAEGKDDKDSAGLSGSGISIEYQGLRIYLLDPDGELASNVIDVHNASVDTDDIDWIGTKTKDGQSGTWGKSTKFYKEHWNGMPLPLAVSSSGKWSTQGEAIRVWMDQDAKNPEYPGWTNIQVWFDSGDVFELAKDGKNATEVFAEKNLTFMFEPILWIPMHDSNSKATGEWFYGTPTNYGNFWKDDWDANYKDSGGAVVLRQMFPQSIHLAENLEFTKFRYTGYTPYNYSGGSNHYYTATEIANNSTGHAIGRLRLESGGTSTWDDPDITVPGPSPAEEGDGTITIVKNYVSGENPETHVTTVYRDNTLRDILVENEPDVDAGYVLVEYYDSTTPNPKPADTVEWEEILSTIQPVVGATSDFSLVGENFHVQAPAGGSLSNQSITLTDTSYTLVVKLRKQDGDFTLTDDPYIFIYL